MSVKILNGDNVLNHALLIGINYIGSENELNGCINDTYNLFDKLVGLNLYKKEEILIMTDRHIGSHKYPSRNNILSKLGLMVQLANKNPLSTIRFLVAYSGHGSYIKDSDGDEKDKRDEVLCPVDFAENGFISDDELRRVFVNKLPKNVQLTFLCDSCNSGTVLDLKYNYQIDDKNSFVVYDNYTEPNANVTLISGCLDNQTSADAYLLNRKENKYQYQGAMTASFLANYRDGITTYELLESMRKWMKKNQFTQTVQLSSGKYLNTMKPIFI